MVLVIMMMMTTAMHYKSVHILVNADFLHLWHQHLQEPHDGLEGQFGLPAQNPGGSGGPGLWDRGSYWDVAKAGARGVRNPRMEGWGWALSTARLKEEFFQQ